MTYEMDDGAKQFWLLKSGEEQFSRHWGAQLSRGKSGALDRVRKMSSFLLSEIDPHFLVFLYLSY